jgi:hypothetical protein
LHGRNVNIDAVLTLLCCWLVHRVLSIGSSHPDPQISKLMRSVTVMALIENPSEWRLYLAESMEWLSHCIKSLMIFINRKLVISLFIRLRCGVNSVWDSDDKMNSIGTYRPSSDFRSSPDRSDGANWLLLCIPFRSWDSIKIRCHEDSWISSFPFWFAIGFGSYLFTRYPSCDCRWIYMNSSGQFVGDNRNLGTWITISANLQGTESWSTFMNERDTQ